MSADTWRRYRRIAPNYDLLDLSFEYMRYQPFRRMLFYGMSRGFLDAGVGTGRNMPFFWTSQVRPSLLATKKADPYWTGC